MPNAKKPKKVAPASAKASAGKTKSLDKKPASEPEKSKASPLDGIRHSLAHLLAAAVLKKFPKAKLAIGPVIENGFYYDFLLPRPVTPEDMKELERSMRELARQNLPFKGMKVTPQKARVMFKDQPFKLELIKEFSKDGKELTVYSTGDIFSDLCRGGHVENTKEINPEGFMLDKVAGAYWRGDEKNPQLTRIYGLAFANKQELSAYNAMMDEARKRDHKKLGKELGLFAFSPLVGPGLPLFLPKGETVFSELEGFMREEKKRLGYKFVHIPHIAKADLYKKSGHLGKYDAMMPIMTDDEGNTYVMKAMNCPHHFEIYNAEPHSYRDLPYRIAETTTVYRNEKSGELSGLVRVKSLTQDDTHHMIRHDQIQSEIEMILGLMDKVYSTFDFKDYVVQISIRDPKNPNKYFGDNKLWKMSEEILINAVKKWGRPYSVEEGEAAFYGPKIDIMVKDSIGRNWQLTTIQLDFNQPENFSLRYTGEDGEEHAPAVLHVAILGSVERFMGVLIEHFAGAFPLWLAPVQAVVLPVGETFSAYAEKAVAELKDAGIRAELAEATESLGKRIRLAEMQKIPYVLVVGDKEQSAGTVAVRHYKRGQEGTPKLSDLIVKMQQEIEKKSL